MDKDQLRKIDWEKMQKDHKCGYVYDIWASGWNAGFAGGWHGGLIEGTKIKEQDDG